MDEAGTNQKVHLTAPDNGYAVARLSIPATEKDRLLREFRSHQISVSSTLSSSHLALIHLTIVYLDSHSTSLCRLDDPASEFFGVPLVFTASMGCGLVGAGYDAWIAKRDAACLGLSLIPVCEVVNAIVEMSLQRDIPHDEKGFGL